MRGRLALASACVLGAFMLGACTPGTGPVSSSSAVASPSVTGRTDGPRLPTPDGRTRDLQQVRVQILPLVQAVQAATERAVGPVAWEDGVQAQFQRSLSHTCAATLFVKGKPRTELPDPPSAPWMQALSDEVVPYRFERIDRVARANDGVPRLQSGNGAENAMLIVDQRNTFVEIRVEVGSAGGCPGT